MSLNVYSQLCLEWKIYTYRMCKIFQFCEQNNKHEVGYGRWLQTNLQAAVKLLYFHLKVQQHWYFKKVEIRFCFLHWCEFKWNQIKNLCAQTAYLKILFSVPSSSRLWSCRGRGNRNRSNWYIRWCFQYHQCLSILQCWNMCHFCCLFSVLEFKNKTYRQSEVSWQYCYNAELKSEMTSQQNILWPDSSAEILNPKFRVLHKLLQTGGIA